MLPGDSPRDAPDLLQCAWTGEPALWLGPHPDPQSRDHSLQQGKTYRLTLLADLGPIGPLVPACYDKNRELFLSPEVTKTGQQLLLSCWVSIQPSFKCFYCWCLNPLVWKTVRWISHSEEKWVVADLKSGPLLEDLIPLASGVTVFSKVVKLYYFF